LAFLNTLLRHSSYAGHIYKEGGDRSLTVIHEIDNKFFFISKRKKRRRSSRKGCENDSDFGEIFLIRNKIKEKLMANFPLIDLTNNTNLFG